MRKVLFVVGAVATNLMLTAAVAMAQSSLPTPNEPNVKGEVVTPPGGTAFTGGDFAALVVAVAVLLGVGIALYTIGRRRAASTA
jgi:hypothetical protein